jgi:hypothetical protein
MDGCYIPNNPHYGLVELQGAGGGPSAAVLGGTYTSTGGIQVPAGLGSGGAYWSPEDMGSFSLPPLDLDPLPSLFPFSPCPAANYK